MLTMFSKYYIVCMYHRSVSWQPNTQSQLDEKLWQREFPSLMICMYSMKKTSIFYILMFCEFSRDSFNSFSFLWMKKIYIATINNKWLDIIGIHTTQTITDIC